MRDCDLLSIGGGPAGLTAAYEGVKSGLSSLVLERSSEMGGIARTVRHKGYRFDIGGHRFFTKVERVQRLWEEILGEDFLWRPRLSRIYYNGRFFSYPLKPIDAFLKLGPVQTAACVGSLAAARVRPRRDESSFDSWVINRFGQRLFDTFFRSYTEKVWGVPCSEIKAEWAAQRIKSLSLAGVILNAFTRGGNHTSLIERFQYPRFGPGQMWEACRDRIVERGGAVVTGLTVTRLRHDGRRIVEVVARDAEGREHAFSPRHVISSMPLTDLFACLDPAPPPAAAAAAAGLKYRDFITVALVVDRPRLFPDNWIYIHAPDVAMGRIQNFGNWSPDMVPDSATSCLGLEYFCFAGDRLWSLSDNAMIDLGHREVMRLGLLPPGTSVIDGAVVRMEKTYPMYVGSFNEDIGTIRSWLATLENLHCCGRNGQHRYNNQDHSMYTACLAVENILGARHDIWNVNVERVYHETVVDGEGGRPSRPPVPAPAAS